MNLAFDFNPVALRTVPYSALGAGFILKTNPIEQFYSFGLGGQELLDGRLSGPGYHALRFWDVRSPRP